MDSSNGRPPVGELLSLRGSRALVTGASGNIGRGIALRLAEAGAKIVVHYFSDEAGAEKTVAAIAAIGGDAISIQANLQETNGAAILFAAIDGSGAAVDCVVNNAAVQPVQAIEEVSTGDWQAVMAANLDGAFRVTQAAAKAMQQQQIAGSVVNIASIEGSDPAVGHSHYSTSKAGLIMFTRTCALEYGAAGIRFNSVSPGLIDREGLARDWPDGVERWLDKAPLGRLGESSDVADAVLFLLSPAARWISGTNLIVDGGMSSVSRW